MSRINRQDIDRKTNKPNPAITEGFTPDVVLNRANQVRRDDDVIKTPRRSIYDIDYAMKAFIDKEIQPQIIDNDVIMPVSVVYANGEKWDNVRRLGYMRDEKGMLQSPLIMLKRNSFTERDSYKTLDVNRNPSNNYLIHRNKYNSRNRYEDTLFPFPLYQPAQSVPIYVVDIPKYVTVEYEMMLWCDFSTQLNELVNQIFTYNRFSWGIDSNRYHTTLGSVSFETINTVSEDRLVRATIPMTVLGTLQNEQEVRTEAIKKMYSIKKLTFETIIETATNIFDSTSIPVRLVSYQSDILSGGRVTVSNNGNNVSIDASAMIYLTTLTDKQAYRSNNTTITVAGTPKINPVSLTTATVNEFDIYINGQYIDKVCYTWTPNELLSTQTIVFDTAALGYTIDPNDLIIINGRWA
jgi:hypothetical protein